MAETLGTIAAAILTLGLTSLMTLILTWALVRTWRATSPEFFRATGRHR